MYSRGLWKAYYMARFPSVLGLEDPNNIHQLIRVYFKSKLYIKVMDAPGTGSQVLLTSLRFTFTFICSWQWVDVD